MLRAVGNPVAVNPDPPLAAKAKEEGWQILRFERLGRRLHRARDHPLRDRRRARRLACLAGAAGAGGARPTARRGCCAGRFARLGRLRGRLALLWGFPYLLIKIAVDGGLPPLLLAWGRIVLAAAVLLAIAWRAGSLAPLRRRGRWLPRLRRRRAGDPVSDAGGGGGAGRLLDRGDRDRHRAPAGRRPGAALRTGRPRPTAAASHGLLLGLGGVAALVGIDVAGSRPKSCSASPASSSPPVATRSGRWC